MSSEPERAVSYLLSKHVSDYMTEDIVVLNEKTRVSVASRIMHKKQRDDVIVTDDEGNPIGIVTDEDILHKIGEFHIDPKTTVIKEIMSSPLITIEPGNTLKEALAKMRDFNIRKLAVISKNQIQGMILQTTIANALKSSTMTNARLLTTPVRAILGNLGFVLQFSGILLIIPAILGTLLNEPTSASSIFLTSVLLLTTGFFLNSYGEKARLNLRQASVLVFLSWLLLILFGTIPYYYSANFESDSAFDHFANLFFASAAGFTTTGISFIAEPEKLPQSFTFYRGFIQFVGGMSFIYLVMTAFYPEGKLRSMRGFISGKTLHLRELFGTIAIIFTIYTIIVAVLLYFLGERNIIDNFSLAMSALATGGFVPNSTILSDLTWQENVVIMGAMFLGALPFTFHYVFVRKRFIPPKLGTEILVYFCIVAIGVVSFTFVSGLDWWSGSFNALAASSTTGFQPMDTRQINDAAKMILLGLMFIGGCGFSTAGGMKVYRLLNLRSIKTLLNPRTRGSVSTVDKKELASSIIILCLFPMTAFAVATHLDNYGFGFFESFFEATAIITNGGMSLGVANVALDPTTKIMLSFVMIFGRVEIIGIIYILVPRLSS